MSTHLIETTPNAGRARVLSAVAQLQNSIDQLHAALAEERRREAREAAARRAKADLDLRAKEISRQAEARIALRQRSVCVPREWFWSFANEAIDNLREQASEARSRGQNGRVGEIERRADSLCEQLTRIQRDELLWTGKP